MRLEINDDNSTTPKIFSMKKLIEQWIHMEESGDPKATDFLKEITETAKSQGKLQELQAAMDFLLNQANQHLDNIENSIESYTIHKQMGELTEVINLAYIARHYFGKTRQWLYQRIKGQLVNGKPAYFTPAEEDIFFKALNDIGLQLVTLKRRG